MTVSNSFRSGLVWKGAFSNGKRTKRVVWGKNIRGAYYIHSNGFIGCCWPVSYWVLCNCCIAAIVGTATSALYVLLIVLITAYVTRKNTIETMESGAEIALRAQQINDTWDAKKTASAVTAIREGVKLGAATRSIPRPNEVPALPLPSQAGDWIPPWSQCRPWMKTS